MKDRRVQTIMAQEVAEQPAAIAATLSALRPMRARIAQLAQGRQQILFVARGSSDNAAIYGRYLLEVHAGRTASMAAPSVATHYRRELDLSGALVVAISQSGRTQEIVATQDWARACGAATIAVTNVEGSPLATAADLAMVTMAGAERAAALIPVLKVAGVLDSELDAMLGAAADGLRARRYLRDCVNVFGSRRRPGSKARRRRLVRRGRGTVSTLTVQAPPLTSIA